MSLLFRPFFETESSTYTYLIADRQNKQAAIIDSVKEMVERDIQFISELGLDLRYAIETHIHADHVTGSGLLRQKLGAQVVLGAGAAIDSADRLLKDGESLSLGDHQIRALATPGHTNGCTSFYCEPYVFTGDALLIRGCGRTDFQQGNSETLFQSVRNKLFQLPDQTVVCPGHDYKGRMISSIAEEKQFNPRLGLSKSLEEFTGIMDNLNLAPPKKIDVAVPANLNSGL